MARGTCQLGFDVFVPRHWQILCGGVPEPACALAVPVSVPDSLTPFVSSQGVMLAGARGSSPRCNRLHLRPRCWCLVGAAPVHRGALLLGGRSQSWGAVGARSLAPLARHCAGLCRDLRLPRGQGDTYGVPGLTSGASQRDARLCAQPQLRSPAIARARLPLPTRGRAAPGFAAAPLAALSAPGSALGLFFLKVSLRLRSDWPFFPDDAPG